MWPTRFGSIGYFLMTASMPDDDVLAVLLAPFPHVAHLKASP